jgi:hypothetical protein
MTAWNIDGSQKEVWGWWYDTCSLSLAGLLSCEKLVQVDTNNEIAQYSRQSIKEGLFAQEKRAVLRIQPSALDIDLIILTFLIFAKKRRDRGGDGTKLTAHDEDPQGDGGYSGAEAGDA